MNTHQAQTKPSNPVILVLFWAYVAIPLAWGVWSTLQKSLALFH
jgi:hypothetical protein